MAGLAVP